MSGSFFSETQCWSLSAVIDLLGGIVQGSGLGPVLFLMFIDDLAKVLEKYGIITNFFADDVKLYLEITSTHNCILLQKALDVVEV